MITCVIMGGLGNQLFQIYTTIALSIETKTVFNFPKNKLASDSRNDKYWGSFLKDLNKYATIVDIKNVKLPLYKEKDFKYDKIQISHDIIKKTGGVMLYGYYQSYKYFDEYYHSINRMLRIDDHKVRLTNKYLKLINEDKPISIHFRRGDYKNLSNFYVLLNTEYYKAGLRHILDINTGDSLNKVLYFCEDQDVEDVDSMIQNIRREFPTILFERADPLLEDWEQLILMSLCRHNIIANSTFSWWGAYLNTSRDKTVVCPLTWFGPSLQKSHDLKDLFLTEWIKI